MIRTQWMRQLLEYLSEPHTTRGVRYSIYHQVKQWIEPGHKSSYTPIDPLLITAMNQQDDLGWRQFMRGRISIT
jgi:hypothetical protein